MSDTPTASPAPRRARRPTIGHTPADDLRALTAIDLAGMHGDTPIPAAVFLATVARFEDELEALRDELAQAHRELAQAREDLGEVLALLRAQNEQRARFWDHAAEICTAFANDGKVRLLLVGGFIALLLVLAGVGGLSYRDGEITISPATTNAERAGPGVTPLP